MGCDPARSPSVDRGRNDRRSAASLSFEAQCITPIR
jgi:hypothetical protein